MKPIVREAWVTVPIGRRGCKQSLDDGPWREGNRRVSNGEQYLMATSAALAHPVSRQWKGYWQRSAR